MAWRMLRYGTPILAVLGITGTLIYQADRRTHAAIDWIELVEGLEERYRAADLESEPTATVITQAIPAWVEDPSGAVWYQRVGSNAVSTNVYLRWAGATNLVYTNNTQIELLNRVFTSHVGRAIWSGWSNVWLTGAGWDATPVPRGPYSAAGYRTGVGYWTNTGTLGTNWVLIDRRDQAGSAYVWQIQEGVAADSNTPPWEWVFPARADLHQWVVRADEFTDTFRTNWRGGLLGLSALPTCLADGSNMAPSQIRSFPATVPERRWNGIARTAPAPAWFEAFDDALLAIVPSYVSGVNPSNGVPVHHTVTGLFATLEIGDRTNQFTSVPAHGTNATSFGTPGRIIYQVHFDERYTLMQALTVTVASVSWTTNLGWTAVSNASISENIFEYPAYDTGQQDPYIVLPQTNVPPWWEYGDLIATPPYFIGDFYDIASRTFGGGTPSTNGHTLTSDPGTGMPMRVYTWDYSVDKHQAYLSSSNGTVVIDQWERLANVTDVDRQTNRSGVLQHIIRQDLTGLVARAEFWGAVEEQSNRYSSAWFSLSNYTAIAETAVEIHAVPHTTASVRITVDLPPSSATNVPPGIRSRGQGSTVPPPPIVYSVSMTAKSPTNHVSPRYQGRRLREGALLYYWDFRHCRPDD